MLGGGDNPDSFSTEKGECRSHNLRVEVYPEGHIQHVRMGEKRGMAEMNKYIGIVKQVKREVAGTITGIPADYDRKALAGKGISGLCCLSFQPGRELEGYRNCAPFPQPDDQIRNTVQLHAPCQ
jgi:hypothetical protein